MSVARSDTACGEPQRLQQIRGDLVGNDAPIGKSIQWALRSERALQMLPGCGFHDGGCHALALAIKGWLETCGIRSSLQIVGREGHADHVVVGVTYRGVPAYIDADGIGTAQDVVEKMRVLEFCERPVFQPYNAQRLESEGVSAFHGTAVPERLRVLLGALMAGKSLENLGDWRPTVARGWDASASPG